MALPTLLAKVGDFQGYATKLGKYFHIDMKEMVRKAIDFGYNRHKPVLEYKKKNGWIKDHVKADIEGFEFVANLMCHPMNEEHMSGWKDRHDNNYQMLRKLIELKALYQDEDSYYDMIILCWLKWIHEHWDRYERSAEQAHQLLNFPNFYQDLIAWAAPLPQDDGTDIEEDTIDYIKTEEAVLRDMERSRQQTRESDGG